jgi:hypothetical protein
MEHTVVYLGRDHALAPCALTKKMLEILTGFST